MSVNLFDLNIPLKNKVIITGKKSKTSKRFWKDVEVGDHIELTYVLKRWGNNNAPKVTLLLNGVIEYESTVNVVGDALCEHFQFELECNINK